MKTEKNITPGEQEENFTSQEAAEYIGISKRSFDDLKLSARVEYRIAADGKSRKFNIYTKSQLEPIKAKRENPAIKPGLDSLTNANESANVITRSHFYEFVEMIAGAFEMQNQKLLSAAEPAAASKKQIDISSFKDKLILNFNQAFHLAGLPKADLKRALDEKKIKSKKAGMTWKIDRQSLEAFCKEYFE